MASFYSYGQSLKVGVSHFDPPFVIQLDKNHFDGFDITMMNYLCKKMDYQCQYIPITRDKLVDAVHDGIVDLAVSGLLIPNAYKSQISFSNPYLVIDIHVISSSTVKPKTFTMDMLNNKNIGVSSKKIEEQIKLLGVKNPKVQFFVEDDVLVAALNSGFIDYGLIDSYTAYYWSHNSSGIIKDLGHPLILESVVAIGVDPNNPELLKQVNNALTEYRNSAEFKAQFYKFLHHLLR